MIYIFFTGAEAAKNKVPFLLDNEMRPITAANAWLRDVAGSGSSPSAHTWRASAYCLHDFFCFLEAEALDWTQITNDTLVYYRDVQDQNRSSHTKAYLSRRTINSRLLAVARFYKSAANKKLIAKDPIQYKEVRFKPPADVDMLAHIRGTQVHNVPAAVFNSSRRTDVKWCPHKEVMRWLNSIDDWTEKLVAKILYRLGLRREELTNLETIELPDIRSVNILANEVCFEIVGKGRKARLVYMSMRDFLELHEYIRTVRATRVNRLSVPHDKVFVKKDGQAIKPADVNRIFTRISNRCGLRITPHMMRHSFAVFALQHWKAIGLSQPEILLKARLGHSSIVTTQIYMHLTDELKAEEALGNASLIELLMKGELVAD
jgi:site-specific recombinase XerD